MNSFKAALFLIKTFPGKYFMKRNQGHQTIYYHLYKKGFFNNEYIGLVYSRNEINTRI